MIRRNPHAAGQRRVADEAEGKVAYLLNTDSGDAVWFSGGTQQDSWTEQFFSSEPKHGAVGDLFPIAKRSRFPVMWGEPSSASLEAPKVEVLDDQTAGGARTLELNLSSPRGAPVLMLDVEPYGAVRAVILGGKRIEAVESTRKLWSLTTYAMPAEGLKIALDINPSQAVNLQVSDQTGILVPDVVDGLGKVIRPRAEDMMPMPNFDYGTVVVQTLRID